MTRDELEHTPQVEHFVTVMQGQKCPLFPLKPNMMGYNFNYAKH